MTTVWAFASHATGALGAQEPERLFGPCFSPVPELRKTSKDGTGPDHERAVIQVS